jgi:NAD(P)-dependent dehydrogenase (short-subunit alcohol dehydrogenase family)
VNMASIYSLIGNTDSPLYHSAKGAVRLMTKTDAMLYAKFGIRVNCIHPGTILTPFNIAVGRKHPGGFDAYIAAMSALHPIGHPGEPIDVAYGALYLASDESRFVTGSELVIDGGYTAQ